MSFAEFIHMGGYGLYVWSSFGMTALLMTIEPLLLKRQQASMEARFKRLARRDT